MSLASYHCSTPQYIIVAHSRIELLFQDWESCVLTDRRMGLNKQFDLVCTAHWIMLWSQQSSHLIDEHFRNSSSSQDPTCAEMKCQTKRFGIIFLGCSSKEPQNNEVLLMEQWTDMLSCPENSSRSLHIWRELQQPRWIINCSLKNRRTH